MMNFKALFCVLGIMAISDTSLNAENKTETGKCELAQTPPMGWNSFDSYGVYLYDDVAMKNLEAFAEKLKPHGYEYFVIDAGWFGEFELIEGTMYSKEKHAKVLNINEYGLLQPSKTYFPNGFKYIIDRCHELDLKFGLHLMRGIPKMAVENNLPIKGTSYRARDIADTVNVCQWCPQNYGVDMSQLGAQEFYNSVINQMAEWQVDFIKYDDIVPYPEEVQAVVNAIKQCGRPIVLSLSPGTKVDKKAIDVLKQANMLRVTNDVWDEQGYIDACFKAWRAWQGYDQPRFWIDMDMIPFGQLQLMSPKNESSKAKDKNLVRLAGKGNTRWCKLSNDQMKTFITLRALSASPLMMGGDLPTVDDFSLSLITNKEMIDCNQNGVMGTLVYDKDNVEIWKVVSKSFDGGWIGVFNRNKKTWTVDVPYKEFGLDDKKYSMYDIFNEKDVNSTKFDIPSNGVIFMKYIKK